MSNTSIVHRDSISRIVTSHWPCLARCRPFCNIEFHRYACQSPTTAITNHGGYGLFRSASSWILREANLWFTRAMFPVRYNSRLPCVSARMRKCSRKYDAPFTTASGKCGLWRERMARSKFQMRVHTRYTHLSRSRLYFLSVKFPPGGICGLRYARCEKIRWKFSFASFREVINVLLCNQIMKRAALI